MVCLLHTTASGRTKHRVARHVVLLLSHCHRFSLCSVQGSPCIACISSWLPLEPMYQALACIGKEACVLSLIGGNQSDPTCVTTKLTLSVFRRLSDSTSRQIQVCAWPSFSLLPPNLASARTARKSSCVDRSLWFKYRTRFSSLAESRSDLFTWTSDSFSMLARNIRIDMHCHVSRKTSEQVKHGERALSDIIVTAIQMLSPKTLVWAKA